MPHQCFDEEDVTPGPIPKNMGWMYTAKDSPQHQLRDGWRPGHIPCSVLRRMEQYRCQKRQCTPCNCSQCCTPQQTEK